MGFDPAHSILSLAHDALANYLTCTGRHPDRIYLGEEDVEAVLLEAKACGLGSKLTIMSCLLGMQVYAVKGVAHHLHVSGPW